MKTKRPKKTTVRYKESFIEVSEYQCPTCKTTFCGGVNRNVTRFRCSCGQELIVEKEVIPYADELPHETYNRHMKEYERNGESDADKGLFEYPYNNGDPSDEEFDYAYKKGFDKRRLELGDLFKWA